MTRRNRNILTYLIGLAIGTALMLLVRASRDQMNPVQGRQAPAAQDPSGGTGNEVEIPPMQAAPVPSPTDVN